MDLLSLLPVAVVTVCTVVAAALAFSLICCEFKKCLRLCPAVTYVARFVKSYYEQLTLTGAFTVFIFAFFLMGREELMGTIDIVKSFLKDIWGGKDGLEAFHDRAGESGMGFLDFFRVFLQLIMLVCHCFTVAWALLFVSTYNRTFVDFLTRLEKRWGIAHMIVSVFLVNTFIISMLSVTFFYLLNFIKYDLELVSYSLTYGSCLVKAGSEATSLGLEVPLVPIRELSELSLPIVRVDVAIDLARSFPDGEPPEAPPLPGDEAAALLGGEQASVGCAEGGAPCFAGAEFTKTARRRLQHAGERPAVRVSRPPITMRGVVLDRFNPRVDDSPCRMVQQRIYDQFYEKYIGAAWYISQVLLLMAALRNYGHFARHMKRANQELYDKQTGFRASSSLRDDFVFARKEDMYIRIDVNNHAVIDQLFGTAMLNEVIDQTTNSIKKSTQQVAWKNLYRDGPCSFVVWIREISEERALAIAMATYKAIRQLSFEIRHPYSENDTVKANAQIVVLRTLDGELYEELLSREKEIRQDTAQFDHYVWFLSQLIYPRTDRRAKLEQR